MTAKIAFQFTLLTLALSATSQSHASSISTQQAELLPSYNAAQQQLQISRYERPGSSEDSTIPLLQMTWIDADQNWLISSAAGEHDTHLQLGQTNRWLNWSVDIGEIDGHAKNSQAFSEFDPYYLHGGSNNSTRYQGGVVQAQLNGRDQANLGAYRLSATGLSDRYAYTTGFSQGAFSPQYTEVHLDGRRVGQALALNIELGQALFNMAGVKTINSAQALQTSLSWAGDHHDSFAVSWMGQRNPLIEEDEQRIMLNYQRNLGVNRMNARGVKAKQGKTYKNTVLIGAGVVAVAAIASSGSSEQDNNERKTSQHQAARTVLNGINPRSVRENREYGGWVYRTPDGRYSTTKPVKGEVASVRLDSRTVPAGNQISATYHTHGGDDPRYLNEQFSPQDISSDRSIGVDGYLGTPAGRMLYHDEANNDIRNLGTIAN